MKITYKGRAYPFPAELTGREARVLKVVGGAALGELESAMNRGDWDVMIALLVIAAGRSGVTLDAEALLDENVDAIGVEGDEADNKKEPDTNPPVLAPAADANGSAEPVLTTASGIYGVPS
jgi:hypothetical protein